MIYGSLITFTRVFISSQRRKLKANVGVTKSGGGAGSEQAPTPKHLSGFAVPSVRFLDISTTRRASLGYKIDTQRQQECES